MKKLILTVLITCLFVAPFALAQEAQAEESDQQWNRHEGFYADANIGTNVIFGTL